MFCDLADSTRLSAQIDPEDMGDVTRAYQETVSQAIRRFDGFIAKFMGDGVRTGLAILDALPALGAGIAHSNGTRFAARIGIASGLVVVGETIGEGAAREQTVVGETPNLAARLQALAGPDAILISAATRDLVGDIFACEGLGAHALKGIAEPVQVWRVAGLREEEEAEFETTTADFPLVGRDEEIGLLRRAWQQTKEESHGQVVFVSGEPGIGKSALVDTLRREVHAEGLTRVTLRCSPYHTNSALYPAVEHFKRLAGWQPEDDSAARLAKLESALAPYRLPREEAVPLFASLLSLPLDDAYPRLDLTQEQLKEHTADTIVALTLAEAERRPLLEVWEDVHWADPSTLDLLGQLIDQAPTVPLLIVLTYRPEFVPPWPARSHVRPLTLNRLERPQIEVMATRLAGGKALPAEVVEHIVQKTDGVPLFVEEMTKAVDLARLWAEQGRRAEARELLHRSIAGLLKDSTPLILWKQKHFSTSWRELVWAAAFETLPPPFFSVSDRSWAAVDDACAHGRFNRTSSSGADHGKGSILISEASSTRGPIPLGQK